MVVVSSLRGFESKPGTCGVVPKELKIRDLEADLISKTKNSRRMERTMPPISQTIAGRFEIFDQDVFLLTFL
jgi:hypothetical protein